MEAAARHKPLLNGWLIIVLLTVCYTFSITDRYVMAFVTPSIKDDLHLSDLEIGLLQGFAFSVLYSVAGPPLGWAVDQWNRMWLIAVALVVWSALTVGCGLAASFGQLAIARFGIGIAEAVLTPAAYSIMADVTPKARFPTASMIYSLGAPAATACSAALAGIVLSHSVHGRIAAPWIGGIAGWRLVFILAGLPGLPLALLVLLAREPQRSRVAGAALAGRGLDSFLPFLRQNWRVHLVYAFTCMFAVVVAYSFTAWNPAILMRNFGWSAGQVGAALGPIGMGAGVLGCIGGGALSTWLVRSGQQAKILWIAAAAMGVALVCGLCAMVVQTGGEYLVIAAVGALIAPLMFMITPTLLQIITPPHLRGRMTALFMLINIGIGAGAGPSLVGAISTFIVTPAHLPLAFGFVIAGASLVAIVGFLGLSKPMARLG